MKLRTTIEVSYNDGITGQKSGIVEGFLYGNNETFRSEDTFNSAFNYEYKALDGYVLINSIAFTNKEELNALYELVKDEVPTGLSYTDETLYLYYCGMKFKMAQTFGISATDIEIVID